MELVEDGNLDAIIKNTKKMNTFIPESDILYIFTQILLALNYIHKRNVLHRDIKSDNILIKMPNGNNNLNSV